MRRRVLLTVGALVLVLVVVVGYQVVRTLLGLRHAEQAGQTLSRQFAAGDVAGARASLREVKAGGATARGHSDNVLWDAGSHLPWLGHDVHAVQVLSRVTESVATSSLPQAVELFADVRSQGGLRDPQGRFDLPAIAALSPRFDRLAADLAPDRTRVDSVDPDELTGPVRTAAADFVEKFRSVDTAALTGAKVTRLLPEILGSRGKRTYVIVAQNNAEIRSTGGLPGSLSLLTATDGRLALTGQFAGKNFDQLPQPALPLTAEEKALFGANVGEEILDVNITPEFPRTAQLVTAILRREAGIRADGVLSIDVVALAELMKATGPITVGDRVYTSENVVPILLNRTYQTYPKFGDYQAKDAYFAQTARGIFAYLTSSGVNLPAVIGRASEAAQQRRLLFWSARPSEQRELDGTRVAGDLPTDRGRRPTVGVYLNDSTASKMSYYLAYDGSVRSTSCTDQGSQTLTTVLKMRSKAPEDVSELTPYITGNGQYAPRGSMRFNVRLYSPVGARITSIKADGRTVDFEPLPHEGHQVAVVGLLLDPGEQVTLTATIRTRAGQSGDPSLLMTPGIASRDYAADARTSCS